MDHHNELYQFPFYAWRKLWRNEDKNNSNEGTNVGNIVSSVNSNISFKTFRDEPSSRNLRRAVWNYFKCWSESVVTVTWWLTTLRKCTWTDCLWKPICTRRNDLNCLKWLYLLDSRFKFTSVLGAVEEILNLCSKKCVIGTANRYLNWSWLKVTKCQIFSCNFDESNSLRIKRELLEKWRWWRWIILSE